MIAIIPARGGSKGLPGKNIRLLNGKPLIAYTIEAALLAHCVDEVIVTTDSLEIATIAEQYGARIPFLRPAALAEDTALAVDVYLHAVEFLCAEKQEEILKFMVLLPTCPLRKSEHIDAAYALFMQQKAQTLVAVKDAPVPPEWHLSIGEDMHIKPYGNGTKKLANRQATPRCVVPCGAIYILDYLLLEKERTYYGENTVGYVMDRLHAVDIDSAEDFEYVEYLLETKKRKP